jgi:hypothetical protein
MHAVTVRAPAAILISDHLSKPPSRKPMPQSPTSCHRLRAIAFAALAFFPAALAASDSPLTTVVEPPWFTSDTGADLIEVLDARDSTMLWLVEGEMRTYRMKNPYGSMPDGDLFTYGRAPMTFRVDTRDPYETHVDTVLHAYVIEPGGSWRVVSGGSMDDRWPGEFTSTFDVVLNPLDVLYISVTEYYHRPTSVFELTIQPLDQPCPESSYIAGPAPEEMGQGTWVGDVGAGESRSYCFRIPESGQWEFRTQQDDASLDSDDTVLSVHTVVGIGPQQLFAGENDDIGDGSRWSSVQGHWAAGTWVILKVSGYGGAPLHSLGLYGHLLAGHG